MSKRKKKQKKLKRIIRYAAAALLVVALVCLLVLIINSVGVQKQVAYVEINKTATPSPTPTASPTPVPTPTPSPEPTPVPTPVVLDHVYEIEVDKTRQVVTVYTLGETGYYDLIAKQFICSTGHCDKIENGWYLIGNKYAWKQMENGSFARYASKISGPYLFHSCCYYSENGGKLKEHYYTNLGKNASSGCIRLLAGDAYWVYSNCPTGTPIHVINGPERDEELLKSLQPPKLTGSWDPTDPDPKNPKKVEWNTDPVPTPATGVTPAPTPAWTVHPTLRAWGYC